MTPPHHRMLNETVRLFQRLYSDLRSLSAKEAIRKVSESDLATKSAYSGKEYKDSLVLDIFAEDFLISGPDHDGHASCCEEIYGIPGIMVSEECGRWPPGKAIDDASPLFILDPFDLSSDIKAMAKETSFDTLGDLFDKQAERIGPLRSRVEGSSCGVTLLKDKAIHYSATLNFVTGEIFVAYDKGVFGADARNVTGLQDVVEKVSFRPRDSLNTMTYCPPGDERYSRNILGTGLNSFVLDTSIRYLCGPTRFTFLMDGDYGREPHGLIAHNGEKIQEGLPSIAVAYFSQGELKAYKLFCEENFAEYRAGKKMTPPLETSLYRSMMTTGGVHVGFLDSVSYPSEFRDSTVVFHSQNRPASEAMERIVEEGRGIRIV